jgi:hypothetical protein
MPRGFMDNLEGEVAGEEVHEGGLGEDIFSLEELSVGMYEIIEQNVSVDKDGLFLAVTKLLGFNKTGKAIHDRFEAALQLLRSVVDIDGNTISIKQ